MPTDPASNGETTAKPELSLTPIALRPREAALALGISRRTLSVLTADRTSKIPHVRLGGCLLFPERELRDWIAGRMERPR